jgi:hypothetical protein
MQWGKRELALVGLEAHRDDSDRVGIGREERGVEGPSSFPDYAVTCQRG